MEIERHTEDEMLHMDLLGGQVRVMLCETTQMVQRARDIHDASPVATAAMGRLMTATAMLGVMMKGEKESVTVTIKGDGPMGTLVAVADHGDVRVTADDPQVELPPRADGKLDVGGAVGHNGRMSVVKDLGMREPYIGQIELVSGELGIDFANYFTVSEQQPSLVSLGVLVKGTEVIKAGGLLLQPLPGCSEETLEQLELRSPMFAEISRELNAAPKEELAEGWFRGMDLRLLDRSPLAYRCTCSRTRMEKALLAIGRQDLQSIIDDRQGAELGCHFCRKTYQFTTEELEALLASATPQKESREEEEEHV
ncbi:MAG: Hsp33 family molecular chaperone HslO [Clostridia bacterium]|nr:Hsp33 family molecular chaperone HslO [Clostridia bacterium]